MMRKLDSCDVVIVGSGMGGAAFAWRLSAQRPELRIVILERGGWVTPSDMPPLDAGWQRLAMGAWAPSPSVRLAAGGNRFSNDYRIDDSASPFKPLMWNGVGGSTVNWAAHFPRLKPSDFRTRSLDGVGDDWPFGYDALEPYYNLNDAMMGVSGLSGDPAAPLKPHREGPPLAMGRIGRRAAEAFNRLGWHWWPADAAILTKPRPGRGACNHCGPCQQGCVMGAKASTDITYLPQALENGVELRDFAAVTAIRIEAGNARGVIYRNAEGRDCEQPAAVVVIAANGIGTVRLALASGLGQGPDDPLGGSLMFHPVSYARGIFNEALDGPAGPIGNAIYSHEFYETVAARGFVRGLHVQITRENPLLAYASRQEPVFGRESQVRVAEQVRHTMAFLMMIEDLPDPANRVSVGDEILEDGLPLPRIAYAVSENTQRMTDFGFARAAEFFAAAGAAQVLNAEYVPHTGWHLLGTARMGAGPATGVVDASGRMHRVRNILVADGSVLPTAGAVNPASTIGAVALKFADDLAKDFGP